MKHPIFVICLICSFCAACKCDPGGSDNRNCFKYLGNCRCVSGVEGKKCNRYHFFCMFVCFFFLHFWLQKHEANSSAKSRGGKAFLRPWQALLGSVSKDQVEDTENVNWKFVDSLKSFGSQNVPKVLNMSGMEMRRKKKHWSSSAYVTRTTPVLTMLAQLQNSWWWEENDYEMHKKWEMRMQCVQKYSFFIASVFVVAFKMLKGCLTSNFVLEKDDSLHLEQT